MQALLYYIPIRQSTILILPHGTPPPNGALVTPITTQPGVRITNQYISDGNETWDIAPYISPEGGVRCGQCRCNHSGCAGECAWNLHDGTMYDCAGGDYYGPTVPQQFVRLNPTTQLVGNCSNWDTCVEGPLAIPHPDGLGYHIGYLDIETDIVIGTEDQLQLRDVTNEYALIGRELRLLHDIEYTIQGVSCACIRSSGPSSYYVYSHITNELAALAVVGNEVRVEWKVVVTLDSAIIFLYTLSISTVLAVTQSGVGYVIREDPYSCSKLDIEGRVLEVGYSTVRGKCIITINHDGYREYTLNCSPTGRVETTCCSSGVVSDSELVRVPYI